MSRSGRVHAKRVAISWLRDSATCHIRKMRELAALLESYELQVEMLTTSRPGFVVYEDDYQVVAEPFRDTGA